ncbi:MAG: SDR family oxidoreductase [Gammaproteobacteria bacterium]|nr:SDR family oxidoreductase [Gammaproteobacteria bacterium]
MQSLKDKTVLITGASSGIGEACAQIFAEQGAHLILCARRTEKLTTLSQTLRQQYKINVYPITLDIRHANEVKKCIKQLPENWQTIDILINNAGLAAGMDKLYEGDIEDWEQMIDTNIKGLLYISRAVIPLMVARNSGHVINIGSISGHEVYAGGAVYCATKFAVNAINKALKLDLHGTPIRVSSIDPGMIETEFSLVRFKHDANKAKSIYQGFTPLAAMDIADAVYYCASRPAHVNIQEMLVLPTAQSATGHIARKN